MAAFRRGGRRAAAADGDALLVRDLLAHGWAPAQDRDRRGASAAHVAAGRGAVDVLGALIASDAALARDRDAAGATPLHWAACGVRGNAAGTGFEEGAAELLLAAGADAVPRRLTTATRSSTGRRGGGASRPCGRCSRPARTRTSPTTAGAPARARRPAATRRRGGLSTRVCGVDLGGHVAGHTPLEHACAYKRPTSCSSSRSSIPAVEYALRVAALERRVPASHVPLHKKDEAREHAKRTG